MKKKISLIVYLLFAVLIVGFCSGCASKQSDGEGNTEVVKGSNIIQTYVSSNCILMLDKKGDLYLYGKYTYGISNLEEPKVIASDVKYFVPSGRLIIVKNDDSAYYSGLNIDGWGSASEFEKVTDNVKSITSNTFCFFIIDKDNNYVVRGPIKNSNSMKYCALPDTFDANFSKVATNVKGIESGDFSNGYVNENNELYVSVYNKPEYKMLLSDVKKVSGTMVLTNSNKLYWIDNFSAEVVKLLDENVIELYDIGIYKKADNTFHSGAYSTEPIKYTNIKIPYYYNGKKTVYLSTNNKLVLAGEVDKYELDLSVESMKKAYEFLQ